MEHQRIGLQGGVKSGPGESHGQIVIVRANRFEFYAIAHRRNRTGKNFVSSLYLRVVPVQGLRHSLEGNQGWLVSRRHHREGFVTHQPN